MSNYRRTWIGGGTYFFTVCLENRAASLLVDRVDELRDAFRMTRAVDPFDIDAIVIMPDHLHALWTLPAGDGDNARRWQRIKSVFSRGVKSIEEVSSSRRLHRERGIWQRRFWEHVITDQDEFNRHIDYIHINPLKHGLVQRVVDWPHSSFHRFVRDGVLSSDWGVRDDPGGDYGERLVANERPTSN